MYDKEVVMIWTDTHLVYVQCNRGRREQAILQASQEALVALASITIAEGDKGSNRWTRDLREANGS